MSRRKLLGTIVAALAIPAAVWMAAPLAASAAGTAGVHVPGTGAGHASPAGTVVTAGSTWTFYGLVGGSHDGCTVLPPQVGKIFTSDAGDTGKWKGTATSTSFTFTSGPDAGIACKFTRVTGGQMWDGNFTKSWIAYGPALLVEGNDPLAWGGC